MLTEVPLKYTKNQTYPTHEQLVVGRKAPTNQYLIVGHALPEPCLVVPNRQLPTKLVYDQFETVVQYLVAAKKESLIKDNTKASDPIF